ncbi:MAG: monovalent cation/H(+) antiporter subunit G [Actinomycetales bacterium]|nr:monovalent cation/H(+) antiporter subunit G [Actinomycetales bacterium]
MSNLTDIVAGAFLIAGASFALVAAIGVARFPDLLNRMHAGTKPQTFGLLLILTGLAIRLDSWRAGLLIAILIVFQMLTAPVSAHMVGRAAFRAGLVNRDELYVCEAPDEEPPAEGHTV